MYHKLGGGIVSEQKRMKTTVTIHKRQYTIIGSESSDHIEDIAARVDETMATIYEANKNLDATRLAVLTALNTMNDFVKLKEEYEALLLLLEEEDKA